MHARIMREVILPAVNGMAADGIPYAGFLYAGVMIDAAGNPKVLEFNCRLGDPETQPIMVRLKSDLVDLVEHGVNGTLDRAEAEWDRRAALGVVLAARGYPESPDAGRRHRRSRPRDAGNASRLQGLPRRHRARIGGKVVVSGGRVLCVTALGDSVKQAQRAAYAAVAEIQFAGMQYRGDIGHRATRAAGRADVRWTSPVPATTSGRCNRASSTRSRRSTGSRFAATNGRGRRAAAASRG